MDAVDSIWLTNVLRFAVQSHYGQTRKGSGIPYVVHPIAVMKTISDWGITDLRVLNAALCHDIIEDCGNVSIETIRTLIGAEAAGYVEELTRVVDESPEAILTKDEQKIAYLASWIGNKSVQSLVIKIADRCCNTQDYFLQNKFVAHEYWNKASSLLVAFRSRRREIDEVFGFGVRNRMLATVQSIVDRL